MMLEEHTQCTPEILSCMEHDINDCGFWFCVQLWIED